MADENRLIVEIELDDGSIKKGFVSLQKQADSSAKNIGKSFDLKNRFSRLSGSILNLRNALIGLASAFAIGKVISSVTRAAAEQEKQVNALNTSLKLAGDFSQEASQSFQDLAKNIQATSVFGDEVVLQFAALARNFTQTNEEAERLTRAAVDLSAATGLSLESSVKNLGKTFAGLTGELGESVPILRTLTAEQLKSGAAIDLILERFGGAAEAQLNTFSGVIASLGNNFGDLLENIGEAITSSPKLIALIGEVNKIFVELGRSISNIDRASIVDTFVQEFIEFSMAANDLFIRPLILIGNTVDLVFNGIRTTVQFALNTIARAASGLLNVVAPNSEIAQNLRTFVESTESTLSDFASQTKQSLEELSDTAAADSIESVLERIRLAANAATESVNEVAENSVDKTQSAEENLVGVGEAFSLFAEGFKAEAQSLANTADKAFTSVGNSAIKGLAQAVGQGFAAFGRALVQGENALEAFTNAFLNSIAQGAIALGTEFILRGIAYQFVPGLQALGPQLIAAGAALAAFGGALSAKVGGESGATAGGGASAGAEVGATADAGLEAPEPEPTNQVNINIQGDVLDSDESSLRIVELLQRELDRSGTSIVQVT